MGSSSHIRSEFGIVALGIDEHLFPRVSSDSITTEELTPRYYGVSKYRGSPISIHSEAAQLNAVPERCVLHGPQLGSITRAIDVVDRSNVYVPALPKSKQNCSLSLLV